MSGRYIAQSDNFFHSSYLEKFSEHLFISDILKTAWLNGKKQIEVSRAEVDNSGYDLILECNKIIRHVQLKSSDSSSKTKVQNVNVKLAEKPGGCVVWIIRHMNETTRDIKLEYLFFGNQAGQAIQNLDKFPPAKHTKANSTEKKKTRANIRKINKGSFEKINSTLGLLNTLFNLVSE